MRHLLATAALALAATSAPAAAAQTGAHYAAVPVQPVKPGKRVTRSTVWNCTETACFAPRSATRDPLLCQLVVREVGALASFRADGVAFDGEALARCNARAR